MFQTAYLCSNELEPTDRELELDRNCRLQSHRSFARTIKLHLWALSLELEPTGAGHSSESRGLKNVLAFNGPLKSMDLSRPNRDSYLSVARTFALERLPVLIYMAMNVYIPVKFACLAYLQNENDKIVSGLQGQWLDEVYASSNSSAIECSLAVRNQSLSNGEASFDQDQNQYERLEAISNLLDLLGDPFKEIKGVATIIFATTASLSPIFYYSTIVISRCCKLRVDLLAFILDPVGELSRINEQLLQLMRGVNESFKNYMRERKILISSTRIPTEVSGEEVCSSIEASDKQAHNLDRTRSIGYANLLSRINLRHLVQPINLNCQHHRWMTKMTNFLLILGTANGFTFSLLMLAAVGWFELKARTSLRLAQLECRKQNILLNRDVVRLEELTSYEHKLAYELYDGTSGNLIRLTALVEARYYFTMRRTLALGEILLNVLSASFGLSFSAVIYLACSYDKWVWLNQISGQVERATKLTAHNCEQTKTFGFNETRNLRLVETLTVAYLNYELFRRQQRKHRTFCNYLLVQIITLGAGILLLSFLLASSASQSYNFFVFVLATYVAMVVNVYMLFGASATRKVERLMKNVLRMMANDPGRSSELTHTIQLWRKQALTDKQVERAYALSLLGVYLTYEKIVTFNFYLLALWLILLK